MAYEIKQINEANFLIKNSRVFLPSKNVNIFPCSRRGAYNIEKNNLKYYDPEARLNTERTNRLATATNGFKDKYIVSFTENIDNDGLSTGSYSLTFVLAGYHIEIKDFNPTDISEALGSTNGKIYAYLGVHKNISLNVDDYSTEILYRQDTTATQKNYLDVAYEKTNKKIIDFFVGVSFANTPSNTDTLAGGNLINHTILLVNGNYDEDNQVWAWAVEQTSLIPNIDHDSTVDSIRILGNTRIGSLTAGAAPANLVVTGDTSIGGDAFIGGNTNIEGDTNISKNLTIGDTTLNEGNHTVLDDGALTVKQILIPYDTTTNSIEGFPNTELNDDGIVTAYVRAGSIKADGLAVGNTITIVDDKDRDDNDNIDEALTTIGKGYISAVDKITVPGVFEAEANKYTLDDATGKIIKTTKIDKVTITAANGLEVAGKTTLNNDLVVTDGAVENPTTFLNLDTATKDLTINVPVQLNTSLNVKNGAAIIDTEAKFTVPVAVDADVTIATDYTLKTPTLDVITIKNEDTDAVTVDDSLTVTGDLTLNSDKAVTTDVVKVNTINSRAIDGTVTANSQFKVDNTLEVTGATTIQSNLTVADNINVGVLTDEEKIIAENGGYIVAKRDIIAKQDLNAGNNIVAGGSATVAKDLTVGNGNDENTGTITATKLVTAPTLAADSTVTTPKLEVDTVTTSGDTVTVDKSLQIDKGLTVTGTTTLNNTLTVANGTKTTLTGELEVDNKATLDNGLEVTNGDTKLCDLEADTTTLKKLVVRGESVGTDENVLEVTGKTVLKGDFTVQHEVDGTKTSFKVTDKATLLGPTGMTSLIVGDVTETDEFTEGTIKTPNLTATESIETPLLNVVNSGAGQANIDNATITGALNVKNGENDTVLITGDTTTITGTLTVNTGKTTLNKGLDVADGLTVNSGDITVSTGALTVSAGDTSLKKTTVEHLTDTGLTNLKSLSVSSTQATEGTEGQIVSDTLVTGDAEANSLTLTNKGQVPALELYHLKTGSYQLRFNFNVAPTITEEK